MDSHPVVLRHIRPTLMPRPAARPARSVSRSYALPTSAHDLTPHLRPVDALDAQAPGIGIWAQLLRYRSHWRPVQCLRVIRFIDP